MNNNDLFANILWDDADVPNNNNDEDLFNFDEPNAGGSPGFENIISEDNSQLRSPPGSPVHFDIPPILPQLDGEKKVQQRGRPKKVQESTVKRPIQTFDYEEIQQLCLQTAKLFIRFERIDTSAPNAPKDVLTMFPLSISYLKNQTQCIFSDETYIINMLSAPVAIEHAHLYAITYVPFPMVTDLGALAQSDPRTLLIWESAINRSEVHRLIEANLLRSENSVLLQRLLEWYRDGFERFFALPGLPLVEEPSDTVTPEMKYTERLVASKWTIYLNTLLAVIRRLYGISFSIDDTQALLDASTIVANTQPHAVSLIPWLMRIYNAYHDQADLTTITINMADIINPLQEEMIGSIDMLYDAWFSDTLEFLKSPPIDPAVKNPKQILKAIKSLFIAPLNHLSDKDPISNLPSSGDITLYRRSVLEDPTVKLPNILDALEFANTTRKGIVFTTDTSKEVRVVEQLYIPGEFTSTTTKKIQSANEKLKNLKWHDEFLVSSRFDTNPKHKNMILFVRLLWFEVLPLIKHSNAKGTVIVDYKEVSMGALNAIFKIFDPDSRLQVTNQEEIEKAITTMATIAYRTISTNNKFISRGKKPRYSEANWNKHVYLNYTDKQRELLKYLYGDDYMNMYRGVLHRHPSNADVPEEPLPDDIFMSALGDHAKPSLALHLTNHAELEQTTHYSLMTSPYGSAEKVRMPNALISAGQDKTQTINHLKSNMFLFSGFGHFTDSKKLEYADIPSNTIDICHAFYGSQVDQLWLVRMGAQHRWTIFGWTVYAHTLSNFQISSDQIKPAYIHMGPSFDETLLVLWRDVLYKGHFDPTVWLDIFFTKLYGNVLQLTEERQKEHEFLVQTELYRSLASLIDLCLVFGNKRYYNILNYVVIPEIFQFIIKWSTPADMIDSLEPSLFATIQAQFSTLVMTHPIDANLIYTNLFERMKPLIVPDQLGAHNWWHPDTANHLDFNTLIGYATTDIVSYNALFDEVFGLTTMHQYYNQPRLRENYLSYKNPPLLERMQTMGWNSEFTNLIPKSATEYSEQEPIITQPIEKEPSTPVEQAPDIGLSEEEEEEEEPMMDLGYQPPSSPVRLATINDRVVDLVRTFHPMDRSKYPTMDSLKPGLVFYRQCLGKEEGKALSLEVLYASAKRAHEIEQERFATLHALYALISSSSSKPAKASEKEEEELSLDFDV